MLKKNWKWSLLNWILKFKKKTSLLSKLLKMLNDVDKKWISSSSIVSSFVGCPAVKFSVLLVIGWSDDFEEKSKSIKNVFYCDKYYAITCCFSKKDSYN